jgi:outer membrane lipoprotein SlyB
MKKTLAILAMALMIVGLTGCIDDQDSSKQKTSSSISL